MSYGPSYHVSTWSEAGADLIWFLKILSQKALRQDDSIFIRSVLYCYFSPERASEVVTQVKYL